MFLKTHSYYFRIHVRSRSNVSSTYLRIFLLRDPRITERAMFSRKSAASEQKQSNGTSAYKCLLYTNPSEQTKIIITCNSLKDAYIQEKMGKHTI